MYTKIQDFRGFGLDVPYLDSKGTQKIASASSAVNCGADGTGRALQQMLNDLGFGPLAVDGQVGGATFKAIDAFVAATGADYTKGSLPKGSICDSIIQVWQQNLPQNAPPPKSGTTTGRAPIVIPSVSTGVPVVSAPHPAGWKPIPIPRSLCKQGTGGSTGVPCERELTYSSSTTLKSGKIEAIKGWWGDQSTPVKAGIGVGGALVVGGIIYALVK